MDRLDELMLEWEERRDRGDPVTPELLCPNDGVLAAQLAERIRLVQAFDDLTCDVDPPVWTLSEQRLLKGIWPPAGSAQPERIGKYEVRGTLGAGGMGVVYHGWDPGLRRQVAVKMIRCPIFPNDARFQREGHALAQLRHPNIVGVYEAGTDDGLPYLAMEYVPGGSLKNHKERFTAAGPVVVSRVMEKVARAVQFAHERGVFHRDLKPANILLGPGDEPMVADFGLAKLQDPDPESPAQAGAEADAGAVSLGTTATAQPGTPAYMAPEQFDRKFGRVGPATDIWALGVILYELAVGQRPFSGPDPATLARQVHLPPDFSAFRTRSARRLAAVIARCLQVRPEQRYSSAAELADALTFPRGPSRRTVLAAGLIAGAGALGALGWKWWSRDPALEGFTNPRAVREALERLARGEPATLVKDGEPIGYRLALGPASGRVVADATDGMQVLPNGYCVVELLPHLPPGEWIVEAALRHRHGFEGACVGTIVGIKQVAREQARGVTGYALTFHEANPAPAAGTPQEANRSDAYTRAVLIESSGAKLYPGGEWVLQTPGVSLGAGRGAGLSPLRELGITLREGVVAARIDGIEMPAYMVADYEAKCEELLRSREYPVELPGPGFHGGVGIYCKFATAEVWSFTVRPAPGRAQLGPGRSITRERAMSIDNIGASYGTGMVTVRGSKVAGRGAVTLYLNGSATATGADSNNGTTWAIGPLTLAAGMYNAKLTHSGGKDVFFTLTVNPTLNSAVVANVVDAAPFPVGPGGGPLRPPG